MDMPSRKVYELRRKVTKFSNFIGADLEGVQLVNPRNITILLFFSTLFVLIQVNGLYQTWPNILDMCQSLFFLPLFFQGIARIYNRFAYNDESLTKKLQEDLSKMYQKDEKNPDHRLILARRLQELSKIMDIFTVGYFIVINIPFVGIIVNALITGRFQFMAPIYIPFIDYSSLHGFIVNALLELALTEFVFLGLICLDFQFIHFAYQVIPMFEVLTMKFKVMETNLEEERVAMIKEKQKKLENARKSRQIQAQKRVPFSSKSSQEARKVQRQSQQPSNELERKPTQKPKQNKPKVPRKPNYTLKGLIKDYKEINDYVSLIYKVTKLPIFMTIVTGGLALCLSALIILSYSRVIGCSGMIFYLCQVAAPCIISTLIVQQYEAFLNEINGFPWYLLSKSDQRIFLQFIQICQNFEDLELPMLENVDMELFTSVVNAGYSYLMFIWNFVDM